MEKWKADYDGIQRANVALKNLPAAVIDSTAKNQLIGESKFLRALYYTDLLDWYGGVPLYDESFDILTDYAQMKLPRSTAEETRAFVIKDLDDAISKLPISWGSTDFGRATRGAAYALRGKVNLYGANYAAAKADFDEVVKSTYGYSLDDNYYKLFTQANVQSPEFIFAIQNMGGLSTPYGMPLAKYLGSYGTFVAGYSTSSPSNTLAEMYEYIDGKPFNWDDLFPGYTSSDSIKSAVWYATCDDKGQKILSYSPDKQSVVDMYARRDPRMEASIILPYTDYKGWVGNQSKTMLSVFAKNSKGTMMPMKSAYGFVENTIGEAYSWRKLVPEENMGGLLTDPFNTPINFPLIRLADVYLMLAEADNELGLINEAVNYINLVRSRPGVNMPGINSGPAWLSATTHDEVFKRIVHERAVELAGEGMRMSDLRRWHLAAGLLSEKKEEAVTGGKAFYVHKFDAGRDYLWPIPQSEFNYNPNIGTQNPGW